MGWIQFPNLLAGQELSEKSVKMNEASGVPTLRRKVLTDDQINHSKIAF